MLVNLSIPSHGRCPFLYVAIKPFGGPFEHRADGAVQRAAHLLGPRERRLLGDALQSGLLYGTAGVKINPKGNILISASVLFPLTDAGLKNRLTTIVGIALAAFVAFVDGAEGRKTLARHGFRAP